MKKNLLIYFTGMVAFFMLLPMAFTATNEDHPKDEVEVTDIATLKDQEQDGTVYHLTGEAVLTFQQGFRNQKYIEDGTAGILIDDDDGIITTTYNIYDGITGIKGTLTTFGNMVQFTPVEDPGDATSSDNEIEPLVVTMSDYVDNFMDYQARLITIEEVFFVDPEDNFANGQVYDFTDGDIVAEYRTTFFNVDYIGDPIPSGPLNITGLPNSRDEGDFMTARHWDDIETLTFYSVTFDVIDEEGNAIEDAVINFRGITYDPGEYFFEEVPVGTHSYSVSKEGFHDASGNVTVSDDDVVHEVMMVEIDPDMITDFPWMEDFSEFLPDGWSSFSYGDVGEWVEDDGSAHHAFTPDGEADSWLVSPQIQLPEQAEGDPAMLLTFMERNQFMSDYEYSGVWISTGSGNPENGYFQEIYESDNPIGDFTERIINLSDYEGKVIYIAFVYQGENAHNWWVDEVTIEEAPPAIEVPDIASLRQQEMGDLVYTITGEVFITHQQLPYRNQRYIQDDTGAILIDDADGIITTSFDLYDGITGLTGNLTQFQDMVQLVPTEDPGEATSHDNVVEPMEITLEDLAEEYQGWLVLVRNVSFYEDNPETFVHNESYEIYDNTADGLIRTPNHEDALDYFGEPVPDTPKDIIGVLHQRFEVVRLLPRMKDDFMEPTNVPFVENQNILLYPNPAHDTFTIESAEIIDMVRVYDISGRLLIEQRIDQQAASINVDMLKTGIYIVRVISENKQMNQKLQINR